MERRIFRQVALERLSSPEQLDHLLAITPPRSWAALVAVLLLLIAGLAWGATASLASSVAGRGVLLRGERLQVLRAPAAGRVARVAGASGAVVPAGAELVGFDPAAAPLYAAQASRLLEVAAAPGDWVAAGQPLLTLEPAAAPLQAAAFVPLGAAEVRPGMRALLECGRLRLTGAVAAVAPLPASPERLRYLVGHERLIQALDASEPSLELRLALDEPPGAPPASGTLCAARVVVVERSALDWLGRR